MSTPVLSKHARERCEEMGISTKVAKRIVQHPRVTYPGPQGKGPSNCVIVLSDQHPEYAVVLDTVADVVVTVLFNHPEDYVREGGVCVPKPRSRRPPTHSKSP